MQIKFQITARCNAATRAPLHMSCHTFASQIKYNIQYLYTHHLRDPSDVLMQIAKILFRSHVSGT